MLLAFVAKVGSYSSRKYFPLLAVLTLTVYPFVNLSAAKVAVILSKDITAYNEALKGFQKEFGSDYTLYNLGGSKAKGYEISRKINAEEYDLVVAFGAKAATVAKEEIKGTPIAFCMVFDPEKQQLIGHSNIAGISFGVSIEKQLKVLRRFVPNARKIGVVYNPNNSKELIHEAKSLARRYNLEIVAVEAFFKRDVLSALAMLTKKNIDVFWMIPDAVLLSKAIVKELLVYTLGNRIPFMAPSDTFVKEGALFSVSADYAEQGERVSELAFRILEGEIPGNIGMLEPGGIKIGINLKTAHSVGMAIPEQLIQDASTVVDNESPN